MFEHQWPRWMVLDVWSGEGVKVGIWMGGRSEGWVCDFISPMFCKGVDLKLSLDSQSNLWFRGKKKSCPQKQ
jgi:hypothetical protein